VTRLIWVILFAVIIGLLAVFTLRMLQSGAKPTADMLDLAAARAELEQRYPRAWFEIRVVTPEENVRNLVVKVEPGRESADPDAMLNNVVTIVEDEIDLSGLDSLLVLYNDSLARALALRTR
jgi:hypothetical protein